MSTRTRPGSVDNMPPIWIVYQEWSDCEGEGDTRLQVGGLLEHLHFLHSDLVDTLSERRLPGV